MHRFFAKFLALPLLAGLLLVSPAAHASTAGGHVSGPIRPGSVSDAQIDASLRAKLAKSKIGKDGFRYHVQRGVVTWEGSTNVVQHKGAATRMAHASGAVAVVNHIQISAAAKAKLAGNLKRATVQ
jgi:hypothetical protein